MKKFTKFLVATALLFVLVSSTFSLANFALAADTKKLRVMVSIPPMRYLIERLGKEAVEITTLADKGADPHSFEPKPSQLKNVQEAELYFSVGLPFETLWTGRFAQLSPQLRFIDLGRGIERLPIQEEEHAGEHAHSHQHEHGIDDPHLWVSPANMKVMAVNAAQALQQALQQDNPALADNIKSNLESLLADIDRLDAEIRALLKDLPQDKRTFMVFHPAWTYYARDYGLRELAVEQEGREARPQHLKELVDEAKAEKVSLMVLQPNFSSRMAENLAASLHLKTARIDPLSGDWPEAMLALAKALAQDGVAKESAAQTGVRLAE